MFDNTYDYFATFVIKILNQFIVIIILIPFDYLPNFSTIPKIVSRCLEYTRLLSSYLKSLAIEKYYSLFSLTSATEKEIFDNIADHFTTFVTTILNQFIVSSS
jgi:hypothetical protein